MLHTPPATSRQEAIARAERHAPFLREALQLRPAVADTFLLGTEAQAGFQFDDDNECRKIGYVGGKRYLRATITPANNASAALISAVWVLANARTAPSANPPA